MHKMFAIHLPQTTINCETTGPNKANKLDYTGL